MQDLSFRVKEGELFAFLGVNGEGKSTTINIICGQLGFNSGSVVIDGYNLEHNVNNIKSSIGVVFQNSVLDKSLTVYDNLESRAGFTEYMEKHLKQDCMNLQKCLILRIC